MYTVFIKKTEKGGLPSNLWGDSFEEFCKYCLDRPNTGKRNGAGKEDFRYIKHYDVKQNGSPILYKTYTNNYIKGSSRVIYATHIAYEIVEETAEGYEVFVDLANTDMWVVDKKEFVEFLRFHPKNLVKDNATRQQINIQTLWNYTKGAYHGAKYKVVESWLDDNQLVDDTIIDDILEGFYSKCL
jgi:hypothetical protein